ncbi:serine hydrolase domain-containing protein [Nonomuraea sp. NPDC050310]|uniref:serine hydrolase domain-containing protein n=1 Tax=unclassified Nonomuraea TaxID=2593643 RepID=UPI0034054B4E
MEVAGRLTELVEALVRPGGPGLAVGVYAGGDLLCHAAAGLASVEFGVPVDERTRFDIASMSKQFTAAAALLLCRDGRLSLGDDIREHLPELRLDVPVTVDQCLRHTGGLREWLALAELTGRPLTRITQGQALALVAGLREVNFAPGTAFSYSNTGYILVTSIIERITGRTLREFTDERIFGPLGMTATHFRDDSTEPLPRFAYGYQVSADGRVRRAETEECAVGDGMIATCVADLGPWFGFLHDGRVLGTDVRDALLVRSGTGEDGLPRPYALGLSHSTIAGRPAIGHAGGAPGYRSQLLVLPEEGLGVAVLTNNTSIDPGRAGARALRLAAGLPLEDPPVEEHADPAEAEALSGYWIEPLSGDSFRAEADGGRLTLSGEEVAGTYVRAADGAWHGLDEAAGLWLEPRDGALVAGRTDFPGRGRAHLPGAAPAEGSTLPPAVYLSHETGVLATITERGTAEVGLSLAEPIEPAPGGGFTAGLLHLRPDGDDLLISAPGAYRLRFTRQPDGTRPLGLPPGLTRDTPGST